MADRNRSGLVGPAVIITLLAVLGIGPTLRRSPGPASAPSPSGSAISFSRSKVSSTTAEKYEPNGGYEHGAGQLLERFFSAFVNDTENTKAWATHRVPAQPPNKPVPTGEDLASEDPRDQYSLRFLIATLPQPTSPPLRYLFDSELHALESAAGDAHYYLDSFDLPWLDEAKDTSGTFQLGGEIDIGSADDKDEAGEKAAALGKASSLALTPNTDEEDRWKRDSGVVLFRKERQLLVVFVVAETPTRGINQVALRDALDQIAWLEGWEISSQRRPSDRLRYAVKHFQDESDTFGNPAKEIRIVGPAFSGSVWSLRNALQDWRRFSVTGLNAPKDLIIRIVSGTATAIPSGALSGSGDDDRKLPTISFKTVQIPDSVLWQQIVPDIINDIADVSKDAAPQPSATETSVPDIAVLEENTDYGRAATASYEQKGGVLELTFPLHISELRTAYQGSQGRAVSSPDLERQDLSLPDEASQQRRDVIPPVSPRAIIYDELVLGNLLTTIRRERIRYIGIVATDIEDLVFLVQQIRAYCPDTVVFTTSARHPFSSYRGQYRLEGDAGFHDVSAFRPIAELDVAVPRRIRAENIFQ